MNYPHHKLQDLLVKLASKILRIPIDPNRSLVAQGLDSLTAEELLESIQNNGYDADYPQLLDDASINSLIP
jgi:aryl carrier-like protein